MIPVGNIYRVLRLWARARLGYRMWLRWQCLRRCVNPRGGLGRVIQTLRVHIGHFLTLGRSHGRPNGRSDIYTGALGAILVVALDSSVYGGPTDLVLLGDRSLCQVMGARGGRPFVGVMVLADHGRAMAMSLYHGYLCWLRTGLDGLRGVRRLIRNYRRL